jgi:hypothetical protein
MRAGIICYSQALSRITIVQETIRKEDEIHCSNAVYIIYYRSSEAPPLKYHRRHCHIGNRPIKDLDKRRRVFGGGVDI